MNTKIETLIAGLQKCCPMTEQEKNDICDVIDYLRAQADQQAQPDREKNGAEWDEFHKWYHENFAFACSRDAIWNVWPLIKHLFTSPPAQPARELSDAEIVAAVNSVASGFRNRPMEVGEVDDEIRQFVRAIIAASQKENNHG